MEGNRVFFGRNLHYRANGGGRDSYIASNNGGFSMNSSLMRMQRTSSHTRNYSPPRPRLNFKASKYLTNGTGRDTYIESPS